MTDAGPVTQLLVAWSQGDPAARDKILPLVYGQLRTMAASRLRGERRGHTFQPTVLVHEVYLRLIDQDRVTWKSRAQFFALASETMRRILVDHARRRTAGKRGGSRARVELTEAMAWQPGPDVDLLALDQALTELTTLDPQQGRVVDLRIFGGLSVEETAEVLGISPATVKREFRMARAWLFGRLKPAGDSEAARHGPGR
jgi:RNA polymerase sigma factor (TIGR02999 family)